MSRMITVTTGTGTPSSSPETGDDPRAAAFYGLKLVRRTRRSGDEKATMDVGPVEPIVLIFPGWHEFAAAKARLLA
jgi:hypothetical protein